MKNSELESPTLPPVSARIVKAYSKPVLRVFGSVKHLTKGGNGSNVDGWGGRNNTPPNIPPGQQGKY